MELKLEKGKEVKCIDGVKYVPVEVLEEYCIFITVTAEEEAEEKEILDNVYEITSLTRLMEIVRKHESFLVKDLIEILEKGEEK